MGAVLPKFPAGGQSDEQNQLSEEELAADFYYLFASEFGWNQAIVDAYTSPQLYALSEAIKREYKRKTRDLPVEGLPEGFTREDAREMGMRNI